MSHELLISLATIAIVIAIGRELIRTISLDGYGQRPAPRSHHTTTPLSDTNFQV